MSESIKEKYVYSFGNGEAEGELSMVNLLGGKGSNLAEMSGNSELKLPVPPGFTITTEVCTHYYKNRKNFPDNLESQIKKSLAKVEQIVGRRFGDIDNPLLLSVRSGARKSMPGMMDTVLNVGLTKDTIKGLISLSGDERFAYDTYRRLIMMYADVVMEKAWGLKPAAGVGIRKLMDNLLDETKKKKKVKNDTDLSAEDLNNLSEQFKKLILEHLGREFPDNPMEQLLGGISAVFDSWNGKRAVEYRRIERIPDEWGTAVTVQSMVFGNMGDDCATGVAFTRNPGNGDNFLYGEYLVNAQGEDVVAGIRTPAPINDKSQNDQNKHLNTLEKSMPQAYKELYEIRQRLEKHYKDMLDIEFTIEKGKLYMLQCRVGKRNGVAAVKMAMDMCNENLIDEKTALNRVRPNQLVELLLPMIDLKVEAVTSPIAKGLPAGPGAALGKVVFSQEEAIKQTKNGNKVILVREETSPEDVEGMHIAEAILTSKGGMTSHAALVARGWGKCCIVGCGEIEIDQENKLFKISGGEIIKEGEWLTLNGTTGLVYKGQLPLVKSNLDSNESYNKLMLLVDKYKKIGVRANADTPEDANQALNFKAEGIGLFRTEHMFYGKNSERSLYLLRKMIMSPTFRQRKEVLAELFPYVKRDIKETLAVMKSLPVTIRLLDPPLHEFVPHDKQKKEELAEDLNISLDELNKVFEDLQEVNPMLGHRGVRLGVTYPEISEMQIKAIMEAAAELTKEGVEVFAEIMVPLSISVNELKLQKNIYDRIHKEVSEELNTTIPCAFGTMIEIPRAALLANEIAEVADFFSYGTNDLTQMTFGFSRDDIGSFLPEYLEQKILKDDPFQTIDQKAVGELIEIGVERGRKTKHNLKIGICGEHGGDPESVRYCHRIGMNYVSCSPFRVPISRLAAAQAALEEE